MQHSESIQIEADARVTLAEVKERFLTSKRHGDGEGPHDAEIGRKPKGQTEADPL